MFNDSVGKIIEIYFACVTDEPFEYNRKTFHPQPLRISETLRCDFNCLASCGGCCPRFSLDYLPTEEHPSGALLRTVDFNGKTLQIYSDVQPGNESHFCQYLNGDARCKIHQLRPFSCDFELIRFRRTFDSKGMNYVGCFPFGRGWSFLKIDGNRGARCTHFPKNRGNRAIQNNIRKFERLKQWTDWFEIQTKIPLIIEWLRYGHGSLTI